MQRIDLKNHEDFINIEGNYGAYQNWIFTQNIRKKFWADRSCGLAAAGNLAYYLTRNHGKTLYTYEDLTIKNFSLFLNDISKFIKPRVYGIPTIAYMKKGFIKFARANNVRVKAETVNMNLSHSFIVEFIKNALRKDYPILMLTWNTSESHLKNHWVTITGFFKDKEGTNFIVTSNWGRREVFNLDKWLKERSLYKGLIYFK